ncbi:MAG: hypothetical protein EXR79_03010 [Myxococcales bacterium]|nr:hypothetical protein [Myxococcales bacterium]
MVRAHPALGVALWSVRAGTHGICGLLVLALALPLVVGCADLFGRKKRKFGASCGIGSHCDSGECHLGRCSSQCSGDGDCAGGICTENHCQPLDSDLDGDGLANGLEKTLGTNVALADSDDDGIADGVEIGDPKQPKDTNGDGTIDAVQSNAIDSDGNCIVDAFDGAKQDLKPLCDHGVCQGKLDAVEVVCDKTSAAKFPAFGCIGCACKAPTLAGFEAPEKSCDGIDNDCNGSVDDGLQFQGLPLAAQCTVVAGICGKESGLVSCDAAGATICKTPAAGAVAEACNALDDDCDGTTDEGFVWQGKTPVGGACNPCAVELPKCPDGAPLNAAVIKCGLDGKPACTALPFAAGFVRAAVGAPQPRHVWTAAVAPGWQRLVLYGGAVPQAHDMTLRADVWSLELKSLYSGAIVKSQVGGWKLAPDAKPGPRGSGALVWDGPADRLVLVGGTTAVKPDPTVWALAQDGGWTDVSALADTDAAHIPPLPLSGEGLPFIAAAHGHTLPLPGGGRTLVLYQSGHSAPRWVKLGGVGAAWADLVPSVGTLTGTAACATTTLDGNLGVVLDAGGQLFRIQPATAGGDSLEAVRLTLVGSVVLPTNLAQCSFDDAGTLHLMGGRLASGEMAGHTTLSFASGFAVALTANTSAVSDPAAAVVGLQRAGGFAAWVPGVGGFLIGGGAHWSKPPASVPTSRSRVGLYLPKTQNYGQVDTESPQGRIGAASGWFEAKQEFCLGGGLLYELPVGGKAPARVVPAVDAWCYGVQSGKWRKVSDQPVLHAFGFGGVDNKAGRLVLAAGLQVQANMTFTDIARLWEGRLQQGGSVDPALKPVDSVHTLDLAAGTPQPVVAQTANAPPLVAPSQAWDPLRNRLLSYGGFDLAGETQAFWSLDLATLTWTNQGAKLVNATLKPQPRYGALAIYDPRADVFAVAAGSIRNQADGKLGLDIAQTAKDLGCFGYSETVVWATQTLTAPMFLSFAAPTFLKPDTNPPQTQLLRPSGGGPAFLPVLYDGLSGRAWFSVQIAPRFKDFDDNKQPCPGAPATNWTEVTQQVSFAFGVCGLPFNPAPHFRLDTNGLGPVPPSLLHALSVHVEASRQAWLWGGVDPDGSLSTALWRLDQGCAP